MYWSGIVSPKKHRPANNSQVDSVGILVKAWLDSISVSLSFRPPRKTDLNLESFNSIKWRTFVCRTSRLTASVWRSTLKRERQKNKKVPSVARGREWAEWLIF
jgi:hypothetical protein